MSLVKKVLRPISYLRIKHPAKIKYDFLAPFFLSVPVILILTLVPNQPTFFGPDGLVDAIMDLVGILTGFFVAALAAVATFDRQALDEQMAGRPMEVDITEGGRKITLMLTRRKFLSFFFGYLALLSLAVYLTGAFAQVIAAAVSVEDIRFGIYLKWAFVVTYVFAFFHLVVNTLVGLYYLTDRIHRAAAEIIESEQSDGSSSDL